MWMQKDTQTQRKRERKKGSKRERKKERKTEREKRERKRYTVRYESTKRCWFVFIFVDKEAVKTRAQFNIIFVYHLNKYLSKWIMDKRPTFSMGREY